MTASDDISPSKEMIERFDMSEEDIEDFKANQYRLKYDDEESVALWLGCKSSEFMLTDPKKAIQLVRASILTLGYNPPPLSKDDNATTDDYLEYMHIYGDFLRKYEEDAPARWAKEHVRK
ncbi:hypothetical protein NTE_01890 [Candidatus Nitrososphaera evergladensis SR1]|uniref:Uncharacterized protein n=1 Tax=Candidatus Nitrososphaera evergladensis SR1 TaxID=1459636 RepID=A0A075MXB9_9ARCH|nr:hypothetical protein [Candidatus Nitrososphaera evergladensis]AIF83949.1 hypothetical protein NTE_01890 [Candidatus Nitrososphaera evergladensis SR1]